MEQFKRNFPYFLFVSLGLKLLILGTPSIFEVFSLLVLGLGLVFFELRVENSKFQVLSSKIKDLEQKDQEKDAKIKDLDQKLGSVRAIQGMKQQVTRNG